MSDSDSFYEELFQDIDATAEAEGIYKEDAFFEKVADLLEDAGEFAEAVRSYFHPARGAMRVDGYCGDPLDSPVAQQAGTGTLGLIILDFSQEPSVTTLTSAAMETNFKRLEKFLKSSLGESFRLGLEPSDPGFGLADLINTRWPKIGKINLYLLTNKRLSSRVQGKQQGSFQGRDVIYNVWDIRRLQNLVESGKEREPLYVDFRSLPTGPIPALLASSPDNKQRVFLTALPGIDLATIYDHWGTRLLEANVRVFLQARSNVNKGIKKTLEEAPELFFSFNNGITATAESVETERNTDGLFITGMHDLQIVNGGQTTASVYAAYKRHNDLSKVYVQMKLSEVDESVAKELVPLISEYANSQNKVSAADFFANHPYHVRIEELSKRIYAPMKPDSFDQTKWYYERARGSYRDAQTYLSKAAKAKFIREYPKAQCFTKTDLAKYLMVWTDKGYMVNRGAQKNFAEFANDISAAWEEDDSQFDEYYFKCLIAKKIIFDTTNKIVQSREWYESGGYRSQHVVLAIGALSAAVNRMGKEVDFLSIWNQQSIDPLLTHALEQAADAAHTVLMKPGEGYRNISEWAKQKKCWDRVSSLDIDWDPDWIKTLLDKNGNGQKGTHYKKMMEQRTLSGSEARFLVLKQDAGFWKKVLDWSISEGEGSKDERDALRFAASSSSSKPTEKQALILIGFMRRIRKSGCPIRMRD